MKHYTSPRIQRAQLFLMKVSSYLEIVCALILIVAIHRAILIAFVPVPTTCTACISTMASIFPIS